LDSDFFNRLAVAPKFVGYFGWDLVASLPD